MRMLSLEYLVCSKFDYSEILTERTLSLATSLLFLYLNQENLENLGNIMRVGIDSHLDINKEEGVDPSEEEVEEELEDFRA